MFFCGRSKHAVQRWVNYDVTLMLWNSLKPTDSINRHLYIIGDNLLPVGLVELCLTWRVATNWCFVGPLYSWHTSVHLGRLLARHQMSVSLERNSEIWWSQGGSEMGPLTDIGNFNKRIHPIRVAFLEFSVYDQKKIIKMTVRRFVISSDYL